MEKITVAVVGAGVAGNFHCKALMQVYRAKVRLKTIVDADTERAFDLLEKWGFQNATADYESVLQDPEIDLVCIALPTMIHAQFGIKALSAGKHVICEKPLTGYFGLPEDEGMYESLLGEMDALRTAVDGGKAEFLYAETYLCFPRYADIAEIPRRLDARVLGFEAQCSIHGAEPDFIGIRKHVGENSLMRIAAYPLSGILYCKQWEARINDEDIYVTGVSADMGQKPADSANGVENFVSITVAFSDGSEGVVYSCDKPYYDSASGSMRNWVKLRCDNGCSYERTMTPADNIKMYFADQEGYESAWQQTNWFNKHDAEEAYDKYVIELNRYIGRAVRNRRGANGFSLTYDCVKIIRAAYLSAQTGRRIDL